MSRVMVRLPESLHQRLTEMAEVEHTSLNQLLVYALTQYVMRPHMYTEVPVEHVAQQQANYQALRERLREGTPEEIRQALDAREEGEPDPFLQTEQGRRLRAELDRALAEKLKTPIAAGA